MHLSPDTKGIRADKTQHQFILMMIKKKFGFHWVLGINYAQQQLQLEPMFN
jgi:hypothetical protein